MYILLPILMVILFTPKASIAETRTYVCAFDRTSTVSGWKKEKPLQINFKVDTKTRKAVAFGNAGSSPIEYVDSILVITFFEALRTGGINLTTITKGTGIRGDDRAIHKGNAVHSRHLLWILDPKNPIYPSQLYGKCDRSVE